MNRKETELLAAYLHNYHVVLEDDLVELRNRVRYRCIDPVDCLELILALERLSAFENFSKNVRAILRISKDVEKEDE